MKRMRAITAYIYTFCSRTRKLCKSFWVALNVDTINVWENCVVPSVLYERKRELQPSHIVQNDGSLSLFRTICSHPWMVSRKARKGGLCGRWIGLSLFIGYQIRINTRNVFVFVCIHCCMNERVYDRDDVNVKRNEKRGKGHMKS